VTLAPTIHVCTPSDLHPYECDGPGKCEHCDQKITTAHDPDRCALCDDGIRRETAE
jgi:hypothetical protein